MGLGLTKHTGPMSAVEALDNHIADSESSIYVLAIENPNGEWYHQGWEKHYDLVTASGIFFWGFLRNDDTILQITVWKA